MDIFEQRDDQFCVRELHTNPEGRTLSNVLFQFCTAEGAVTKQMISRYEVITGLQWITIYFKKEKKQKNM